MSGSRVGGWVPPFLGRGVLLRPSVPGGSWILRRNFLFRMMILDIHLSGCSVSQKPFLDMSESTRRYNLGGRVYMISSFFRFGRKVTEEQVLETISVFLGPRLHAI